MAGNAPFSTAAGETILKGLLQALDLSVPQFCAETGLGYSAIQRVYNGETKRITQPVYDAIKRTYPHVRDEYLKRAEMPIFDNDADEPSDESFNIVHILRDARRVLEDATRRAEALDVREQELNERSKRLDERAATLDRLTLLALQQKQGETPQNA